MVEGTTSDGAAAGGAGDIDGDHVTIAAGGGGGGDDSNMYHTVRLRVEGMMCQKNCGELSQERNTLLKTRETLT